MAILPHVDVIAVCYRRLGELKVFVQSWLNQSADNWKLTVIHDGPDAEFEALMNDYQKNASEKVNFFCTQKRFNDYGHSLRELGLKMSNGDYVLLTNADNYFIPRALEFINECLIRYSADVVLFDMIHSHERPGGRRLPAYSFFETEFRGGSIDISSAIVRRTLAQKAGFRDKTHDGDATYFEDVLRAKLPDRLDVVKIPRVLFVHN